jgi:hypothetical protein
MKNLYSHYRKIKISSRGGNKPEVQGYEEIWHNGQRQVRHWTDEDELNPLPIDNSEFWDFWNNPWQGLELPVTESDDWIEFDQFPSSPRYINPRDVEVEEPVKREWILGEQFSQIKQLFHNGWQKFQRMCQRLPSALKAAWGELNSGD